MITEEKQSMLRMMSALIVDRDVDFLRQFGDNKGEDSTYLTWLKTQPCKKCGFVPHYEMDTFVSCIPCHVRRVAKGSGTGIKPQWNATSLCFSCHAGEHSQGQSYLGSSKQSDAWANESLTFYIVVRLRAKYGFDWVESLPMIIKHTLQ